MGITAIESLTDKHHLTPAGHDLLVVMIEPGIRSLTVTDIAKQAGISRETYYQLMRTTAFQTALIEACRIVGLRYLPGSIHAIGERAQAGDVAAYKEIASMTAFQVPTVQHVHTVEAGRSLRDLIEQRKRLGSGEDAEIVDI